ncbi:glycosyltransferase [Aquabacterium fontiphilum]|uniref:glycosyltransferase family 2 protein n=1 Tax=Aquabacterium fontiphilum TaxID=450365 RepID=UPI001378F469|nr:glycosyltransferase [Aquabacterium fontiphilum]NBD20650.1 glycosyltransferase [Aquabacterium fontiphilum]
MDAYVIIATKGRPKDVYELIGWLQGQTAPARHVVVVGASSSDVEGLSDHPHASSGRLSVMLADRAGLTIQRNRGLEFLKAQGWLDEGPCMVTFFDDDFRPALTWLGEAMRFFQSHPDVVGLTGRVLADGAQGEPLTSADAMDYLAGRREAERHWASGPAVRSLHSLYGCNMAFRDVVVRRFRFDESLPFYGWQEDQDYTGQAARLGRTVYMPHCEGVHLGTRSGRVSGLRFGYSQIANPLYLMRKGTMPAGKAWRFMSRQFAANAVRALRTHAEVDYRGRFRGNVQALADVLTGRCEPGRVIELR